MVKLVTLTPRDRLRLAWELTWPLGLIDAAVVLIVHGPLDARDETLDSIWAVAAFFVASPWVVRRALKQVYGGRKILVQRPGGAAARLTTALTYQESLKVMWLLAWRTLLLSLAALLVFSGLLRVAGMSARTFSTSDPLVNALGLSLVDSLASLAFTPFLAPGMLRKRYRGFRLELGPPIVKPAKPQARPPVRTRRA